jgi:hypothetical protein
MFKKFVLVCLIISIIIGWSAMAKAGNSDLDGYDVYLRNQTDATDIFYYGDPLFTADDLKLEFNNGKLEGKSETSIRISQLENELSATYVRISQLENESYKKYECVMQQK